MDYKTFENVSKSVNNVRSNCIYFCFSEDEQFIKNVYDEINVKHFVGRLDLDLNNYSMSFDIHNEFITACKEVYGFEETKMDYIAVTGTNGKTSVAQIVNKILNRLDKASYLGTSGLYINNQEEGYNGLTTPFADILYKSIRDCDMSSNYFIMEVSSHALAQKRVEGLKYKVAAFTNLSEDHLDFHDDFEDYFNQKKKIINYLDEDGILVINNDDPYAKKINFKNIVTVGKTNSDYTIKKIIEKKSSLSLDFCYKNILYAVEIDLIAEFNVYNYLMAVAIIVNLGYNISDVIKQSFDLSISGRMQTLKVGDSPTVILDFAHSPDSIKKVLKFVNGQNNSKVITVTGSAGQRDASKRPVMGEICSEYSDELIFSEDDSRDENVYDIIADLSKNIKNLSKVKVIVNRVEALEYALKNRARNDIVVLLGKSGQTRMYYDGYSKEYDEIKQARLILEECYGK